MRAVLVRQFTAFDNLTVEEIPAPALERRQVRIDVEAAGISFAANLLASGRYQRRPPLPFVPGTECAGVVVACGADAGRFKPGDRVCAALDWGAHAEETVAYECNVFAIPDNLSFAQAVNFNSYATALAALAWPHLLNVKEGETLLVHGAAGALGLAGVDCGKALGCTVIAVASTDEKRAAAVAHGADHAIAFEGFRDRVNEITGGKGANAILDPVGGEAFDQSLRCIAFEGRIAPVGFTSGTVPQIPANIVLVKNVTVCGLNFGTYYGWSPKDVRWEMEPRVRALMDRFYRWAADGTIRPQVAATFPLDDFKAAMRLVVERKSIGRVALTMEG